MNAAAGGHQQHHQHRCDHNAQQVRCRGTDDCAGDIALGDGGEVHTRLHRRRCQRHVQNAQVEARRKNPIQGFHQQAEDWEQHECESQNGYVQPPMLNTGQRILRAQARAIEEEQEANGDLCGPAENLSGSAACRKNNRQYRCSNDTDDEGIWTPIHNSLPHGQIA